MSTALTLKNYIGKGNYMGAPNHPTNAEITISAIVKLSSQGESNSRKLSKAQITVGMTNNWIFENL